MVKMKIPDKAPDRNNYVLAISSQTTPASLQMPHTGYATTANTGYEIRRKQASNR